MRERAALPDEQDRGPLRAILARQAPLEILSAQPLTCAFGVGNQEPSGVNRRVLPKSAALIARGDTACRRFEFSRDCARIRVRGDLFQAKRLRTVSGLLGHYGLADHGGDGQVCRSPGPRGRERCSALHSERTLAGLLPKHFRNRPPIGGPRFLAQTTYRSPSFAAEHGLSGSTLSPEGRRLWPAHVRAARSGPEAGLMRKEPIYLSDLSRARARLASKEIRNRDTGLSGFALRVQNRPAPSPGSWRLKVAIARQSGSPLANHGKP